MTVESYKESVLEKTLIIITGPTAVGKTEIAINCAKLFDTDIISCDSRQFYKEMNIGTAVPSTEELESVKHHLIQHISVHDYYNVSTFEKEALQVLDKLFRTKDVVVMTGGSGMYIDTICHGIADIPDIDFKIREDVKQKYQEFGLEYIQKWLQRVDPEYFEQVEISNPQRVIRGIEIFEQTGEKYSQLRIFKKKKRDFNIIKICLLRPKEELHKRIHCRVDKMIESGIIEEAKLLHKNKGISALNTVGYRELFDYFDNKITLEQAIENIKTNTRRYAKRQLTWFRRSKDYYYINVEN